MPELYDMPPRDPDVARSLNTEGFILFSYDFTARPSELNPDGAYLEGIRRAAF
jgi:hypothetical protein